MIKYFFLIPQILLVMNVCQSQWRPDLRLTNNSSFSYTSSSNARCISSMGNSVHVVWGDFRDGNMEIYYKRSTDEGSTWGNDVRLTNNSGSSFSPCVSVWNSDVHIVWVDSRNGNNEIYYKHSSDNGLNWGSDIRLTNDLNMSQNPAISVAGMLINVVWEDNRDGNWEIYYKRSPDGGNTWGDETRLTNNSAYSESPSLTSFGQVVHITWSDNRDNNYEIYYKRSNDGGINWENDVRLTNNVSNSFHPTIALSGNNLHVVWYDYRISNNPELFYKHSTNQGNSWSADVQITSSPASAMESSVSSDGPNVHVVWEDSRSSNWQLYYKGSLNGGLNWDNETQLTNGSSLIDFPSMSVSGTSIHVVWQDLRDGNWEIYYKNNPTGNPIGVININTNIPKSFSLSQNYPNPFNPSSKIKFAIAKASFTHIQIFDILGREVTTLVNEQLQPGTYEVNFDGSNLPGGIYFYRINAGTFSDSKKMIMIK